MTARNEVFSRMPDARVHLVAARPGPVASEQGLVLVPDTPVQLAIGSCQDRPDKEKQLCCSVSCAGGFSHPKNGGYSPKPALASGVEWLHGPVERFR